MGKNFSFLIISNSEAKISFIEKKLYEKYKIIDIDSVNNIGALINSLKKKQFDFIITINSNDVVDCFDVLRITKELANSVPVIVIAYEYQLERAINCIKAGAFDFIPIENIDKLFKTIKEYQIKLLYKVIKGETKKERYLKGVLNSIKSSILVINSQGIVVDANSKFLELKGKTNNEILGKKCFEIIAECKLRKIMDENGNVINEDYSEISKRFEKDINTICINNVDCYLKKVMQSKKPCSFVVQTPSESVPKWTEITVSPLIINDSVEYILYIFSDITEFIETKVQMRKFKKIIEQSPVSIVITDKTPKIQFVNPMTLEITGYEEGEVLGRNPRVFQSGGTSKEIYSELWNTISKGHVWRGEFVNKKKNGDFYNELAIISPIVDENENITNYVAIKRDISNEKMLEQKLNQSQKLEVLGYVSSGVAHDFNNILTAIVGFLDLAQNCSGLPDKLMRFLDEIEKASERAKSLTKQLLMFSRNKENVIQNCEVNSIVSSLGKMVRRIIGENIKLNIFKDYKSKFIMCDPGQFDQVLMNLIVNATHSIREKKHPEKLITVVVEHVHIENNYFLNDGNYSKISVKDSGCGIPQNIIDKIFDPFFTTKKKGEGTGLGLSMVLDIVRKAEGNIEVESKLGVGTQFTVYWPSYEGELEKNKKVKKKRNDYKIDFKTLTILIVEDEVALKGLAEKLLLNIGCNVISAKSGEVALDLLKIYESKIDLMFTDIIMTGIDGIKLGLLAKKIRPEMKVLYTTGYSNDFLKKNSVKKEELFLLEKPYSSDELYTAIEKIFARDK